MHKFLRRTVILTTPNCVITQDPGFIFRELQLPFFLQWKSQWHAAQRKETISTQRRTNTYWWVCCEKQGSNQASWAWCYLPKIAAFWWEFFASAAQPNCKSNFSKLCPLPIWLPFFPPQSLLSGVVVQQRLFLGINVRCTLFLLMLQHKEQARSWNPSVGNPDKILLVSEGGVNDFLQASQRKLNPTECLCVSRKARRQNTAQRATLNKPDSHWKWLRYCDISKYAH